MSKPIRISKQLSKLYPQPVVNQIKSVAERYHIKSFKAETVSTDKQFYVSEGEHYTGVKVDGTVASFEAVHNNTVGASGLSYRIGEQFTMPAGTYLINVYYYTKYFMTVYQIEA